MTRAETYNGGVYRLTLQPRIRPVGSVRPERAKGGGRDLDLSPAARAAWLRMRDEGGWWTSPEIGREMVPELGARAALTGGRWVSALLKRGHLVVHAGGQRVKHYGVTARCLPIPGETLDPAPLFSSASAA